MLVSKPRSRLSLVEEAVSRLGVEHESHSAMLRLLDRMEDSMNQVGAALDSLSDRAVAGLNRVTAKIFREWMQRRRPDARGVREREH